MLTVKTNLLGSMYTAKLAFHFFKLHSDDDATRRRSRGSLVLLGSMCAFPPLSLSLLYAITRVLSEEGRCTASYFGLPLAPVYSASKHGILGLFNSLSTDAQVYDIACVFRRLSLSLSLSLVWRGRAPFSWLAR